jgi:hypothetical protein
MPPRPKQVNVPASSFPMAVTGMKPTKLEYQALEDEQEKTLRLHKDRWTFYVKELLPWAMATIFLGAAWVFSLWIFTRADSSPAEKDWARTIFTAITSAAAGILFGKQLGK